MSKNILVIPDSHAHPDYHNDRFTWLGKLIVDVKPDIVVHIGDHWDMASLCAHAKPKELEGGRYQRDLDAGHDGLERINHEIRRAKKKLPRRVFCLGNHDIRADRFVDENPQFQGFMSSKDLDLRNHGWEEVPFLEPIRINDVAFAHYYPSGVMGRPIGGLHPAYSMAVKGHESRVAGHSHVLDYKVLRTNGRSIMGLDVGCYVDYNANYAGQGNEMWSRGICLLKDVEKGLYDLEYISIEKIRKTYGGRA